MLSLTVKNGHSLRVGDAIITIETRSRGQVKVHIDAPREIEIVRSEIDKRKPPRTN